MFFDSCQNMNDRKAEYKKLAMKHHPDMGGDVRTMQATNAEYNKTFAILKELQNMEAEQPESHTRKTTEGFDPYYEPSWWRSDDGLVEDGDWGGYDEHGIGYDGQLVTWAY